MPIPEDCGNGADDDCDGRVDCSDVDSCAFDPLCVVCAPEICDNVFDDDCDGIADCADPDCFADPRCAMCIPVPEVTFDERGVLKGDLGVVRGYELMSLLLAHAERLDKYGA